MVALARADPVGDDTELGHRLLAGMYQPLSGCRADSGIVAGLRLGHQIWRGVEGLVTRHGIAIVVDDVESGRFVLRRPRQGLLTLVSFLSHTKRARGAVPDDRDSRERNEGANTMVRGRMDWTQRSRRVDKATAIRGSRRAVRINIAIEVRPSPRSRWRLWKCKEPPNREGQEDNQSVPQDIGSASRSGRRHAAHPAPRPLLCRPEWVRSVAWRDHRSQITELTVLRVFI